MNSDKLPTFQRQDILAFLLMLVIVGFAWCTGNGKWSGASWGLPTAYLDVWRSDIIGTFAGEKAAAVGDFVPVARKYISQLGAPMEAANWNDWPIIEEFHIYFLGLLARAFGLFTALNIWMLLGHLTAAASFYGVARYWRCTPALAYCGGVAFGLAPFIFAQFPHHSSVATVWHVPLFLLVWDWIAGEEGLPFRSRRFLIALLVGLLAGVQNVYFTNVFCQLALLSGGIVALRQRAWQPLLAAVAVTGAAAAGFGLMNLDTWLFRLEYGPAAQGLVREYKWLEVYSLKFVDLFIPPLNHLSPTFAQLAARHQADSILQNEWIYLGLVGIAALLFLVGTAAWNVIFKKEDSIPIEAWQVAWILAMFSTGGLNFIVGAFGFTLFRATGRLSIVILAIVLMFAVRRLSALPFLQGRGGVYVAAALSLIILWDQMPAPPSTKEMTLIATQVAADRKFVSQMEKALPKGAMIFQLPIMEFPEGPVPGITPYDHLRPYLYSKDLRFSFGSMKGRADSDWQKELAEQELGDIVRILQDKGFAAIYINRNGFPDQAAGLLDALAKQGWKQRVDSAMGDLVCVLITPESKG